jgi:hypothetical protein
MFVRDEQQGFKVSGSNQWVLAVFIDFSSSGERQSPPLRQILKVSEIPNKNEEVKTEAGIVTTPVTVCGK